MSFTTPEFAAQERARLVAAAQDLFRERGIGPVEVPEVALLPATVAAHFPTGKPALVAAVTARYLAG